MQFNTPKQDAELEASCPLSKLLSIVINATFVAIVSCVVWQCVGRARTLLEIAHWSQQDRTLALRNGFPTVSRNHLRTKATNHRHAQRLLRTCWDGPLWTCLLHVLTTCCLCRVSPKVGFYCAWACRVAHAVCPRVPLHRCCLFFTNACLIGNAKWVFFSKHLCH